MVPTNLEMRTMGMPMIAAEEPELECVPVSGSVVRAYG